MRNLIDIAIAVKRYPHRPIGSLEPNDLLIFKCTNVLQDATHESRMSHDDDHDMNRRRGKFFGGPGWYRAREKCGRVMVAQQRKGKSFVPASPASESDIRPLRAGAPQSADPENRAGLPDINDDNAT